MCQKKVNMMGSSKWRNKKHRCMARQYLDNYLVEFIWRQNPFTGILNFMAKHFPPRVNY